MKNITIIGICGGSGSGKSTLARRLEDYFEEKVTVIRQDDYYKSNDHLSDEERRLMNYDHPSAFDTELLISHLDALKRGETVTSPIYDYTRHTRSEKTRKLLPRSAVILEGMLIFENKELLSRLDLKIFVDTEEDVRLCRRIARDVTCRGRSEADVKRQFFESVKPMHDLYVEPSRVFSDMTVPEGGLNEDSFLSVMHAVSALIK